jgi:hypothetical protein
MINYWNFFLGASFLTVVLLLCLGAPIVPVAGGVVLAGIVRGLSGENTALKKSRML